MYCKHEIRRGNYAKEQTGYVGGMNINIFLHLKKF